MTIINNWFQKHLVCKRTLNHLAKLAKLAKVPLMSLKIQISYLFQARSYLTFKQLQSADSLSLNSMQCKWTANISNPLEYYRLTKRCRSWYWYRTVDFFRYHFYLNKVTYRPCASYHLTSWRKLALIQNSSAQIPKTFHPHGIIGTTKMILGINDIK